MHEAGVPEGVLNLVTASDPMPIGEEFCTNPLVRKITFTGSTAVGRKLGADAAPHLKRVSMELGGHAPFIVFADADPVHAAKGAALVKFLNSGQACICPNRIFVHQSIEEAFLQTLTQRVSRLVVGNGMQDGIAVGPLVNRAAVEKVSRQVDDAREKGADVLCGGNELTDDDYSRGHFYSPTVLSNVSPEMQIYREKPLVLWPLLFRSEMTMTWLPWLTTPTTGWRLTCTQTICPPLCVPSNSCSLALSESTISIRQVQPHHLAV